MTVTVQIGELTFHGDGSSTEWIYTHIPGWYSGAPIRGGSESLPTGDGASPIDRAYRSARTFIFEGTIAASSVEEALELWQQFAAVQADGALLEFTVTDPLKSRSCLVSINGTPELIEISTNAATVRAPFIAYDPVKYGPTRTLTVGLSSPGGGLEYPLHGGGAGGALYYGDNGGLGRGTLTNDGTAKVWPSVSISGGLTAGFFVQRLDTGEVVRYDRVVPAGSTVDIDFRTGEVLVDGISDGSTYLTRYEFFGVGPKESIEVQFNAIAGSSGTPGAVFSIADGDW